MMKKLLTLLLSTITAFGSTITGPVADLTGSAFNPRIEFWPLSTPFNIGNTNIVGPMKSVALVNGNFSLVLIAGSYRVKFPPTTNSFIIHVPTNSSTYSLVQLSTNVASITGITTTPATARPHSSIPARQTAGFSSPLTPDGRLRALTFASY